MKAVSLKIFLIPFFAHSIALFTTRIQIILAAFKTLHMQPLE
jgi:hypothetical protein